MTPLEPVPVELSSTLLVRATDDAHRSILQLEFRDGSVYRYLQVPKAFYQNLLSAASHGTYFNHRIRGRFPFLQIQPPC